MGVRKNDQENQTPNRRYDSKPCCTNVCHIARAKYSNSKLISLENVPTIPTTNIKIMKKYIKKFDKEQVKYRSK